MKRLTGLLLSFTFVIGCIFNSTAFAWGGGPKLFRVEVACGTCGNSRHSTITVCADDKGGASRKAEDIARRTTCKGFTQTCNVVKVKNNCKP